jgi:cAMP-dependent protein kinase regulator
MAAPVTVSADWEPPFYEKTPQEYAQIKKSISRNFLFAHLDEKDLEIIIHAMKLVSFDAGDNIINQGEGEPETAGVLTRCDWY